MIPLDVPPQLQERVACSIAAATKHSIPAHVLLAVVEQEGGKPGQWVKNTNGTHDVGPLQFNTAYLAELARFGIKPSDVAGSGCYPYELAAWRLSQHLKNDTGDVWSRAANYHSRTPAYNQAYRAKLVPRGEKWAALLNGRHPGVPDRKPTTAALEAVAAAARAPLRPSGFFPQRISFSARTVAQAN